MQKIVAQLNLQESLGGGEVYTRFLVTAFYELGWKSRVFVNPRATFWPDLLPAETEIMNFESISQLESSVSENTSMLLTHSALDAPAAQRLAKLTSLVAILHMPLYERLPGGLPHYHRLMAVSRHVADSARARGLDSVSPVELLGVADFQPRGPSKALIKRSCYDWDRRKIRDRIMGWMASLVPRVDTGIAFEPVGGALTLGIVSRLTPIKQFPLMFRYLAPVIAMQAEVRLEIFGSGGYASVRDLRRALRPCASQVRFWGHQSDVQAIYRRLDYVLSGLPEKEALGLNLIEAQACGTPVLAVNGPPFTETVVNGESGFLFEDPRNDGGKDFAALLQGLLNGKSRPDPRQNFAHLQRFSAEAFRDRLEGALEGL